MFEQYVALCTSKMLWLPNKVTVVKYERRITAGYQVVDQTDRRANQAGYFIVTIVM